MFITGDLTIRTLFSTRSVGSDRDLEPKASTELNERIYLTTVASSPESNDVRGESHKLRERCGKCDGRKWWRERRIKEGEGRTEVRPALEHHSWEPKCFLIGKQWIIHLVTIQSTHTRTHIWICTSTHTPIIFMSQPDHFCCRQTPGSSEELLLFTSLWTLQDPSLFDCLHVCVCVFVWCVCTVSVYLCHMRVNGRAVKKAHAIFPYP